MIKKIIAKLVSSWDRMPDAGKQHAMAEERHRQIITQREAEGRKKYVSERTTPVESEITGPSVSKTKDRQTF